MKGTPESIVVTVSQRRRLDFSAWAPYEYKHIGQVKVPLRSDDWPGDLRAALHQIEHLIKAGTDIADKEPNE